MPLSSSSPVTKSEIESFHDVIENERVRYTRKGFGLTFAVISTYAVFFILPDLVFPLYALLPHDSKI